MYGNFVLRWDKSRAEGARVGLDCRAPDLGVAQLQQFVGQTELVHDLHDGRVDCVPP